MIRTACKSDIPALMEIYNEQVLNGVATFDTVPKTYENRLEWFTLHSGKYRLIVKEEDGEIVGYASLSPYHDRPAFYPTAEISVYIKKGERGKGYGKALMKELIKKAEEDKSFHVIISLVTSENIASCRLHESLGFSLQGEMKEVGEKFGKILSLKIYEYII